MIDEVKFAAELQAVRPVTRNLIESLAFDVWPRHAAIVDFGIDSDLHYAALKATLATDEVMPSEFDAVLGSGKKITALCRRFDPDAIEFRTAYDNMGPLDVDSEDDGLEAEIEVDDREVNRYVSEPDECSACSSTAKMDLTDVDVNGEKKCAWLCYACGMAHVAADVVIGD